VSHKCFKAIGAELTEMPRLHSTAIQYERPRRRAPDGSPTKQQQFLVSVVLPASGCEMIAKVRRQQSRREAYSSFCFSYSGP
jgi:hypothetical protein